ncbi:CcdB family protein [Methylomonas methanica]|nr:CcdB family protein [Methylomonas methanica]
MARFDVYRNSGVRSNDVPYLLDVQADILSAMDTRVVVPLRRRDRFSEVRLPGNLVPILSVEGVECLMETPKLAAVPVRVLKAPVASLESQRLEIGAALDFLFQGF